MDHTKFVVEISPDGEPSTIQAGVSSDGVVKILLDQEGATDTTLTITAEWPDDQLLVAINGSEFFVGLVSPAGLFEYVATDETGSDRTFMIDGQVSRVSAQKVIDRDTAASVARA